MATSTSSYFSNSIVGVPQVAGEGVDLFASDSTPKFALGTKFERQDGCVFRYGNFSAATSAGTLVASTFSEVNLAYATAYTSVAPASTYQMPDETVGVYPGSIGSRYIVAATTGTINQFAGAYIVVGSGTGAGYAYRVRGNTAYSTPATGLMRISLYDQIQVALAIDSTLGIVGNVYNDMITATTTSTVISGVVLRVHAASRYGWVQTQGNANLFVDSAIALGQLVTCSATTNGFGAAWTTVTTANNTTAGLYPIVGILSGVVGANKCNVVKLGLE
jgi:hypothetical protein